MRFFLFESSVNPEGIQTQLESLYKIGLFESSVNPEGIQTSRLRSMVTETFESSVNPEGIQTFDRFDFGLKSLRVV